MLKLNMLYSQQFYTDMHFQLLTLKTSNLREVKTVEAVMNWTCILWHGIRFPEETN